MASSRTRFSVNLNKFALLRNSRGKNRPAVVDIAERCLEAGAHGITVHPRVDQRHTKYADVAELKRVTQAFAGVELNVEGAIHEELLDVVLETRPEQCTLVPDTANQLTSDHGWNVVQHEAELRKVIERLHRAGVRVSLFLDPSTAQVRAARGASADRIELYTESYADAYATSEQQAVLAQFRAAAEEAQRVGLGVNAGHDLNLQNLRTFLLEVQNVLEVSIGHAFVCDALDLGLEPTLAKYLEIVGE